MSQLLHVSYVICPRKLSEIILTNVLHRSQNMQLSPTCDHSKGSYHRGPLMENPLPCPLFLMPDFEHGGL